MIRIVGDNIADAEELRRDESGRETLAGCIHSFPAKGTSE